MIPTTLLLCRYTLISVAVVIRAFSFLSGCTIYLQRWPSAPTHHFPCSVLFIRPDSFNFCHHLYLSHFISRRNPSQYCPRVAYCSFSLIYFPATTYISISSYLTSVKYKATFYLCFTLQYLLAFIQSQSELNARNKQGAENEGTQARIDDPDTQERAIART